MRTKEYFKEYRSKERFCKKLERMKAKEILCDIENCNELANTLHHKDENHFNNQDNNLQPVCKKHHLELPHFVDVNPNYDFKGLPEPKKAVHIPKTVDSLLENCSHFIIHNVTIRNPDTCIRIKIQICSRHTLEYLLSLGFKERILPSNFCYESYRDT